MKAISCADCGIVFGMPDAYVDARLGDKVDFYCPNGHRLSYKESTLDKVSRERDQLKQQIARIEDEKRAAEKKADAAAKKLKRAEKRHNAGLCAHCNRSFSQLSRHMASKHPDKMKPQLVCA